MRILITNDDGIHSSGLTALERVAAQIADEVWVVAPELDQSGLAHSLTLNDPLRLRQVDERRFALRGTPTDCVIMALRRVMPERPDLILSGINVGRNVADDVLYSGTVAGAIEGTLLGIPSIALSQAFNHAVGRDPPWATAEAHAPGIIRRLIEFGFDRGLLFNINFPNLPADEVKGIEVSRQGRQVHGMFAEERRDGRGLPYFWLHYQRQPFDSVPGTDIHALEAGMIALTPLRLDLTDHETAAKLATAFPASGKG